MADLTLGELIDPAAHKRNGTVVKIPTGDLTTHGVIVGMTGSGKTGLAIVLIEECLSAGVPTILIDPKGDLANLCLTFPDLAPADFQPWVNEGDAQKAGVSVAEFAAQQASTWKDGLASWGVTPDRIRALRDKVDFTIYTPGSTAGVPLNIVGSLQAPADPSDVETMRDEIDGFVSGLLGLVGIQADPLSSREHILLANLIELSWSQGRSLDLPTLVGMVPSPPIRKLGVFELDQFFPPADRMAFAMRLNGLLASTAFAAWSTGVPLDIAALQRTPDGRPRCAIVSIAHLSDDERQFVVSLLLSKVVTWMRAQSGTTDLRTLVYMDEVAGYVPPTAVPPTKKPIMLLMKQARAFGVGVVLATQNPVDVDYKALSNAGTWMIGRLQTERDKARLLDGMSAAAGTVDVGAVGDTISGLGKREFVLKRASRDTPDVFTSRWAMSYLRGPLTRDQIETLMHATGTSVPAASPPAPTATPAAPAADGAGATAAAIAAAAIAAAARAAQTAQAASPTTASPTTASPATASPATAVPVAAPAAPLRADATPVMPIVAAGVPVRFADPAAPWIRTVGGDPLGGHLSPAAVARFRLRFDDPKAGLDVQEEYEVVLHPLGDLNDAAGAVAVDYDDRDLRSEPVGPLPYVLGDAPLGTKTFWTGLQRDLTAQIARSRSIDVPVNRAMKLYGRPGESLDAFTLRCQQAADDAADKEAAALRDKYETKLRRLEEQLDAAKDRLEVAKSEKHSKLGEELLSTAGSVLGSFLGGRKKNLGSVLGKLGTAAGRRGRTTTASKREDAAEGKVQALQEDYTNLEQELTEELGEIKDRWDDVARGVESVEVGLEKTDVALSQLVLVWVPVA